MILSPLWLTLELCDSLFCAVGPLLVVLLELLVEVLFDPNVLVPLVFTLKLMTSNFSTVLHARKRVRTYKGGKHILVVKGGAGPAILLGAS
jgi:hypothetical protein